MSQQGVPAHFISYVDGNNIWTVSSDKPLPVGLSSDINSLISEMEKDYTAGGRTTTIANKSNSAALNSGVASNGVKLSENSTPYIRAYVLAMKPGATHVPPSNNTGTIYISTSDNVQSATPLAPGAQMELPPNCNLEDFLLIVATANDGVIIIYTT